MNESEAIRALRTLDKVMDFTSSASKADKIIAFRRRLASGDVSLFDLLLGWEGAANALRAADKAKSEGK